MSLRWYLGGWDMSVYPLPGPPEPGWCTKSHPVHPSVLAQAGTVAKVFPREAKTLEMPPWAQRSRTGQEHG